MNAIIKYNEVSKYGKRISAIDTSFIYPCERVSTYYFKGLFYIFLLRGGEVIKYRITKKF